MDDTPWEIAEGALKACDVTLLAWDASLPFEDGSLFVVQEQTNVIINAHVDANGNRWMRRQVLRNLVERIEWLDAETLRQAIQERMDNAG